MTETKKQTHYCHIRLYRKDTHVYHLQMEYPDTVKHEAPAVETVRQILEHCEQNLSHLKFTVEYFESRAGVGSHVNGLHLTLSSSIDGHEEDSLEAAILLIRDIKAHWQNDGRVAYTVHDDPSMVAAFETYLQVRNREKDVYTTLYNMVEKVTEKHEQMARLTGQKPGVADDQGHIE